MPAVSNLIAVSKVSDVFAVSDCPDIIF